MKQQSKLVKSFNIKLVKDFDKLMVSNRVEMTWRVIFKDIFIKKMTYEKAGAQFGKSKQHIYGELKKLKG